MLEKFYCNHRIKYIILGLFIMKEFLCRYSIRYLYLNMNSIEEKLRMILQIYVCKIVFSYIAFKLKGLLGC